MHINHRQCKRFKILVKQFFCSTAKGSFSNFLLSFCPDSFMLCKKAVYDNLSPELYTRSFSFELKT